MNDKAEARLRDAFGALQLGQFDRAERLLQALLRKTARHFDALVALGTLRGEQGRFADAAALFERAAKVRPDHADAHYNLGVALTHLGKTERAVDCYRSALRAEPRHLNACNNLAAVLFALDRPGEALACVQEGLAHHPGDAQLLSKRGAALNDTGRIDEAIDAFRHLAQLQPNDPLNHGNLGLALRKADRSDEAARCFERAVSLDPRLAIHHNHLGLSHADSGRMDAALASLRRAVELDPQAPEFRRSLGLTLLANGDFEEGWKEYEFRQQLDPFKARRPAIDAPLWRGGRIDGTLLVWGEQGLGDEILHASMIPDLLQRTEPVALEVEPRLAALFARSFPGVTVIPAGAALAPGPFAAQEPIASLGRRFRPNWEAFPKRDRGYLVADDARTRALRWRLDDGRTVIGLSWVSKAPIGGAQKSARLADFAALLRSPGCRFVDLQYGDTHAEREAVERELGICVERLPDIDNTNDLDGLAALMGACDAVVTVSNTTAHLAGALGRPTWVMVPHGHARIWYWFRDRDKSPWYPHVRVRRQQRGQSWSELIAAVASELRV